MNKNPVIKIITLIQILISGTVFSQDFNLFNPSNELYLFSAYDEGANGFRYNPAVLGLKHKLNAIVNAFLQNTGNNMQLNELELSLNAGNFGLAYRFSMPWYNGSPFFYEPTSEQHTFSLGFGIGNKTFCSGLLFEMINSTYYTTSKNVREYRATPRFGLGFLYRPFKFLSTSFVYRSSYSFFADDALVGLYQFGAALRPFFTNKITLLGELNFLPSSDVKISKYSYKFGVETSPLNGISIRAVYERFNNSSSHVNFFNIGLSFILPHSSVSYNNAFLQRKNSSNKDIYLSQGNGISLSFNSEKKESIIPEPKKVVEITLSGSLQDFHTEDVFFGLLGKGKRSVHEVIADIDYAAEDPSVKGLLLKIYPISSGRFEINAAIEELTAALERFKKKGKFITAYLPQDTRAGEYYIATF
ncbi:MAG TPA: hypothetical protein VJ455_08850, partial [Ignavibacteria bacterium]|nr:hypothetical protein [Ignavibacteria bacterium]